MGLDLFWGAHLLLCLLASTSASQHVAYLAPRAEEEASSLADLEEGLPADLAEAAEGPGSPTGAQGAAEAAETGRFPYMVSIRAISGQHYCTGVLVSPSIVLTVAQCVDLRISPLAERNPTVWVGVYVVDEIRADRAEVRKVTKTKFQPQWTGDGLKGFDLAVLYLDAPVETLMPIRLMLPNQLQEGMSLDVLGFGRLSAASANSPVIQSGTMTYVPRIACEGWYGPGYLPEDKVCAGLTTVETCHGDLGSPLIIANNWNSDFLVGLASVVRQDCGTFTSPSIFSWVVPHMPFIWDAIDEADP